MIESGSHVVGIDWESFGIPAGTALRYERPAAALKPFFPSYAVLDSDRALFAGANSRLLPGWAKIWVVLAEAPVGIRLRNRTYAASGQAMLLGPTSCAMPVTSSGGVSVVIDISPLGWARWFDVAAEEVRDRFTPLADLWPVDRVEALIRMLFASDRGPSVKPLLDGFLLRHLPSPNPQEDRITRTIPALCNPERAEAADVAASLGISAQALLRLARRNFGFGPKLVIRRARFLRAFVAMLADDAAPDFSIAPIGYHDVPHFLRDGKQFLGLTPRRFMALPMDYMRAAVRARRAVIGSAWPPLDPQSGIVWSDLGES